MMQKAGGFFLLFFFLFFLPGFLLVAAVLSDSSALSLTLEAAAVDAAYVDAIDTKNAMWTVVKLLEPKAYLQFMCTLVFKARAHLYYGLFQLLKRAGNLRQSLLSNPSLPLP